MKKLELKEQPKPKAQKWTKAHLILNNAKEDIKKFIKMEAALLYKAIYGTDPDFAEDGGWIIDCEDLCGDLFINVEMDNYVEDRCYERHEMAEIIVLLDDTVIVRDKSGDEWNDKEITIEELAHVADLLELTYLNRIK